MPRSRSPQPIALTALHLRRFRQIQTTFPTPPPIPGPQDWQRLSANAVWDCVFRQVVAVGGARPADTFMQRDNIRRQVSYHRLCRLKEEAVVQQTISGVLREIGTRYARKDWRRCAKTTALGRNLLVLREFAGGPKGFIAHLAAINGTDTERERIRFVTDRLHFIKNKGARDLLTTSFGLLRNSIAFDARVLGALRVIGVPIPSGVPASAHCYAAFEADLVQQVCRPLRLTGAELDQLLFSNYAAIKTMAFHWKGPGV